MDSDIVLKTENLTKFYGKKKVVDNISLSISKGAIYGLIGKNGSGKTTTMRLILGLANPSSGKVEFSDGKYNGKDRKKLSAVIEYPAFYPFMTAFENLKIQSMVLNLKLSKEQINDAISFVGLDPSDKKKVKNYSLGMKQRLAIANALLGEPEFLFLDEPINGLDPQGIRDVRELILNLNKEKNITIMISSHILGELQKVATKYAVINNGYLVDEFSAETLKERVKPCIKIKVNDMSRAIETLSQDLNVVDYRMTEDEIFVYDRVSTSDVTSSLVNQDLIIDSITSKDGDYEDYFIQLMGGSKK